MVNFTSMTPYIEVFDMNASVAFYRDLLGFDVLFASPSVRSAEGRFSHFVRLGRGGAELMLNTAYDSNERPSDRSDPRWSGCRHVALYVACDDVEALYAEAVSKGLVAGPPTRTGYGFMAFSASDPDGFRTVFQQPA